MDQSNPEADCKETTPGRVVFLPSNCIFHPGRLPGWCGSEQSRGRLQGKSHLAEWYSSHPTAFSTLGGCQGGVDQSNPEADCKENHTWQSGIPPTVFFLYQSCTNLNFPTFLSADGPFCNTPTPWTSPLFSTHLTHCATFCKNFFKMTDNPKKNSLWHKHATTAPRYVAFYLIFPLCKTQYFL